MTHTSTIFSEIYEEAFLFYKQILNAAEDNAEIKLPRTIHSHKTINFTNSHN